MNRTDDVIIVTGVGNPRDPRTWSGTPASVVAALERGGATIVAHDARIPSAGRRLSYYVRYQATLLASFATSGQPSLLGCATGLRRLLAESRADYNLSRPVRAHRARAFNQRAVHYREAPVLHMGASDLPHGPGDMHRRHYVFCDCTYHSYTRFLDAGRRYGERVARSLDSIEREAYKQVDHFFSTSEYVREDLVAHYGVAPSRVSVVGTGCTIRPEPEQQKNYANGEMLFVAKVWFEEKGGSLLLDAFRLARQREPALKLTIVGQESVRRRLGDVPGVTVKGFVSENELNHLYAKASLFVMPAPSEPWGLVYLEALAAGVPVLGLNRNALPEITDYGRYGILVDEACPEAVASAIVEATRSPGRLRKMGNEGRRYCLAKYSWERTAEMIAKVVLGRGTPADAEACEVVS